MYKLTFDTSATINAFKNPVNETNKDLVIQYTAANKLREAHEKGLIEITYNSGEQVSSQEKINFRTTQGPWIIGVTGYSELGVSTILADRENDLQCIEKILNPKSDHDRRDFANLAKHTMDRRDIFVSEDKRKHLKKAEALKQCGVKVMSAMEAVRFLQDEGVI